jgi:hypothetical protein
MKKPWTTMIALLALQTSMVAATLRMPTTSPEPSVSFGDEANRTGQDGNSEGDAITIAVDQNFATTSIPKPATLFHFRQKDPLSDNDATTLIKATINPSGGYCIIHAVQWKPLQSDADKADVAHELWFLYKASKDGSGNVLWKKQKDFDGKRIYGSKDVAVLLIHLGPLTAQGKPNTLAWDISYKVAINKKTPAPFQHAIQLIGALSPTGGGAPGQPPPTGDFWGGQSLDIKSVPSDIVVSASIAIEGQQNKEFTNTYDDEGFYHWDVSLGVPIESIKELQFVSEGNKVTTAPKKRQDVYGFLNIYLKAVDVKADKVLTIPHLVFGVPLASKPLQHPFAGVGIGVYKAPIKFNVFAGVTFNRERVPRSLVEGQTATPSQLDADLRTRWVRKFTFGINFPIGQIKNALKK